MFIFLNVVFVVLGFYVFGVYGDDYIIVIFVCIGLVLERIYIVVIFCNCNSRWLCNEICCFVVDMDEVNDVLKLWVNIYNIIFYSINIVINLNVIKFIYMCMSFFK